MPHNAIRSDYMTNSKCTLLMITGLLMAGCSEEAPTQRILSDAEKFDGTVHIEALSLTVSPDHYTHADVNITNYTDYTANFVKCDLYGYYNNVLVVTDDDVSLFANKPDAPDLEPGQTRATSLAFLRSPVMTRINRMEWVCSYQEGRNLTEVIFEGRS